MNFRRQCCICGQTVEALHMLVVRFLWWTCSPDCAVEAEKRWQKEYGESAPDRATRR